MKLLVDMNLSPSWVERLAGHGFEAVHWSTIGAATAPDVEILTWANEHHFVIITNDLDFSAILAAGAVDGPSGVQLRTQDLLSESAARIVARALEAHREDIERGTTYLVFEPLELLERLASLTPRPRINLLLYYGVLGARSAWRSRITASDRASSDTPRAMAGDPVLPMATDRQKTNWRWAELMQRSFGFDVLACPHCGDRLELIALIEDPSVIRRLLRHLGLPTDVPAAGPARPPPLPMGRPDTWYDDDLAAP